MLFSFGNLLTVLIVFIILVIYRQLDRNNRSLEKVKRYSDHVIKDIQGFVDDKTAELRDISIELQVNLKTGKEILNKIRGVEQGLKQRAGEIDGIGKRISDYDRVLKDLIDMTARVENNLKGVQNESRFVDNVGRQIKEAVSKIAAIEKSVPAIEANFVESASQHLSTLKEEAVSEMQESVNSISAEVADALERVKDFSTYITRLEGRRETLENETIESLKDIFNNYDLKAQGKVAGHLEKLTLNLNGMVDDAETRIKKQELVMVEAAKKGQALEHQIFIALKEKIYSDARQVKEHCKTLEGNLSEARSVEQELNSRITGFTDDLEEFKGTFSKSMEKIGKELEINVFEQIEQRLGDYEGDVDYRFKKLEDVHVDIEAMEKNLRQVMGKMSLALKEDFEAASQSLEEKRQKETDKADERFNILKTEMKKLEEGLAELKSRAYQTVSEQLQVFEDDFFKDLKKKNLDMEERVREWQRNMDSSISEIARTQISEREEAEKTILDQLRKQYEASRAEIAIWQTELKQKLTEAESEVETKIKILQSGSESTIEAIGNSFNSQRDDLVLSTQEERAELKLSLKGIAAETGELQKELQQKTETAMRDFQRELNVFGADFKGSMRDLGGNLNDMDKRLKDFTSQTGIFERADTLKLSLEAKIGEMKIELKDLKEQRKDINETSDQLLKIKKMAENIQGMFTRFISERRRIEDMDSNFKKLLTISSDVNSRIEAVHSSQDSLQEIQARIRELENLEKAMENRYERLEKKKDILEVTTDGVDKNFQMLGSLEKGLKESSSELMVLNKETEVLSGELQKKLQQKTEIAIKDFQGELNVFSVDFKGSMGLLGGNLNNMDKRLKDFTSQTGIFERADTLKLSLEAKIGEMKIELKDLKEQRKDINETSDQLLKIKKMAENIQGMFTRFISERRRIEDMDSNFKKLLTISSDVNSRIEAVHSSQDSLQEIQARIRELENLEKAMENRYERLEKKKDILEVTTDGVDKNFQMLGSLEKGLKESSSELKALKQEIEILSTNKEKADAVVDKLNNLDDVLSNLDDRIKKFETSRDWLARTETRFEKVSREAQDQVQLLQSILKTQSGGKENDKGAPPLSQRETVIKLARHGWSAKEIAKQTKLSRGEVELILELAPRG